VSLLQIAAAPVSGVGVTAAFVGGASATSARTSPLDWNAMKAGVPAAEPAGERRSALGIEQHR